MPNEFGGAPFAVLGSDARADVVLTHPDVSRRHAYLQVVDGRLFVVDLGSRTGLRIDGLSACSGWVSRSVEVGPYRIEVEPDASGMVESGPLPPAGPLENRAAGQGGMPEILLEARGAEPWRMKAAMILIGSASGCRVRLSGDGISRHHAALVRTPSGAWVVDLMSRSGLSINGAQVRVSRIGHGDELKVGRFRIQIRSGTDLPALIPPSAIQMLQAPAWLSPPSPPTLPAVPGEDPRLDALIRQVGQMQQQMFEQFQQALMMMFQAFRTMHQDQADRVKSEVDRLRSLGEELQQLQAQAARPPAPSPHTGPPNSPLDRPIPPRPALFSPQPPNTVHADVHLTLHRRIAAIQEERQGRWQKILSLMAGGTSLVLIQAVNQIPTGFWNF